MQLILAIDSDPRRSEQLATLVRARFTVDLVQATSAGEGLHALRDRVPDLILTAPLISPFDDGVLDEYLRDLGAAATHVQTVRIPMLSAAPKKKSSAKTLFGLGRKKKPVTSAAAPDGCDPKVFADEIAHYLTRSLEERSSSAKAAEDRSASAQASAERASAAQPPAQARRSERDEIWQSYEEPVAPQALVEAYIEPIAHEAAPIQAAPIVEQVEETYVPGAIFNLRPAPAAPVRTPEPIAVAPEPFDAAQDEMTRARVVEPEPYVFAAPEPQVFVEPERYVFAEPEPVVLPERDVQIFVEPEPAIVQPEIPAVVKPAVHASAPVATHAPASAPAPATPAGTSPSFEAALAAIRAAWAKPASTPAAAPSSAPVDARPTPLVSGSAEVDLTNEIDALEDVAGVDAPADDGHSPNASKTSLDRHKADKASKRPEKPRGRKTRGDGRDDLGAFDPKTCDFAALVNKLDEVTEDEVTGRPATNVR